MLIAALGLTQIIGYGTLYYAFSILAPGMAADFGVRGDVMFGVFSLSLLLGGLCAPAVGRSLDRLGAGAVMAAGSVLSALLLCLCALAPLLPDLSAVAPATGQAVALGVFTLALTLLGAASGMVQYQAAFAALVQSDPERASRTITRLTLIGGFASTIFWPVSTFLAGFLSWRGVYLVFAGLNLLVCLPVHLWIMRKARGGARPGLGSDRPEVPGVLAPAARRRAMILVSLAFAANGFAQAAMLAHLVPVLGALGLGGAAVAIGSLFGPAQVLSRLATMMLGTRLSPLHLAILSTCLIVLAVVILLLAGDRLAGAVLFSLCLGLGGGIASIAQGSLPLHLFGSQGYGLVTGRMASVRLVAGSAAPFLFATTLQTLGLGTALVATAGFGALGILAFLAATARS